MRLRAPFGFLLVLLFFGATFSGCTAPGPDPGPAGPDDPGEESDPDDQEVLQSLLAPTGEFVPEDVVAGVEEITDRLYDEGGAVGYVFDNDSRAFMGDVQVVVQCILNSMDLPVSSTVVKSDADGRFVVPSQARFVGCEQVVYQAISDHHTMITEVASPPLVHGKQYLVLIALRTTD